MTGDESDGVPDAVKVLCVVCVDEAVILAHLDAQYSLEEGQLPAAKQLLCQLSSQIKSRPFIFLYPQLPLLHQSTKMALSQSILLINLLSTVQHLLGQAMNLLSL